MVPKHMRFQISTTDIRITWKYNAFGNGSKPLNLPHNTPMLFISTKPIFCDLLCFNSSSIQTLYLSLYIISLNIHTRCCFLFLHSTNMLLFSSFCLCANQQCLPFSLFAPTLSFLLDRALISSSSLLRRAPQNATARQHVARTSV